MIDYNELEKLNDLRQRGVISEEEFQKEKEKILNHNSSKPQSSIDPNQYSMFIHLSQFLGVFTGIGLVAPVILWLIKKDESPIIDNNGKIVINWILSFLIYAACAGILCFIVIGIPLLIALGICDFIFIILGSLKASSGVLWKYPLSIEFFTVKP